MSKLTTVFSVALLLAASEFAGAQNGVCRVTAYSIESSIPDYTRYSDPALVGEFDLKFEGSMIVERFQHKESGLGIFVHVTRINKSTLFNKKPMTIRFVIQLLRTPEDSYSFYGGAAESIYDKNWRGSSVSSHLRVGDYKGYTFTLACEKRKK
jgi:hypothetical protein